MTFDTQNHWPGRAETVRSCLDVLSVCCVSPKVQLMLCDKFELPEVRFIKYYSLWKILTNIMSYFFLISIIPL